MYKFTSSIVAVFLILSLSAARADSASRPATQEEKEFYASVIVPAMTAVKNAMPAAPEGWTVASETKINSAPLERVSGYEGRMRFFYAVTYKRVTGVKEEQKMLNTVYTESSTKQAEAAKSRVEELIKQQTETSLALRKATRNKNRAEMQRLNDELEENGRKMRAIHDDVDTKISRDVEKYLVKDAEVTIRVTVNENIAELTQGESLPTADAAFALRKEGKRIGVTSWEEGQTLFLYGNWQPVRPDRFRANVDGPPFSPKAKTIVILLTGDRKRVDKLLKQIDQKAILNLMK